MIRIIPFTWGIAISTTVSVLGQWVRPIMVTPAIAMRED